MDCIVEHIAMLERWQLIFVFGWASGSGHYELPEAGDK
jgi:hypothetical protein